MPGVIDRAGQRYGRLVFLSYAGHSHWMVACDCGATKRMRADIIVAGRAKSCGCWNTENAPNRNCSHGHASHEGPKDPTYQSWRNAKARCYNMRNTAYASYGARGIAMCDRWRDDFLAFLADMGERPKGTSLDRINNDLGYEPGNCRWASSVTQAINKRHIRLYEWRGEHLPLKHIAVREGVHPTSLAYRIRRGENLSDAVPLLQRHHRRRRPTRATATCTP